jgi:hypothetical protein
VSCRQQIEHGTRRRARHPLELVRQAADGPAPARPGPGVGG